MKKFILFVDDDIRVLNSLKSQCREEFGNTYHYEMAESAEEGLEIFEDFELDESSIVVVVSDWLMPGMKGDEFLVEIHKRFPKVKKVMLTGQADENAIKNAKEFGGLEKFLSKPWNAEDIFKVIRSTQNEN